eukprot:c5505_g1_i1.p1 GENE.c5505_g1_i1~~c5505_g1_i1.p1  ORF type:complete len:264 (+),score=80.77 c5505_g1_i1:37-792(+)
MSLKLDSNFVTLAAQLAAAACAGALIAHLSSAPRKPRKMKLTYFNFDGAAEKIRLACALGGVQFEDVRITNEQWLALKPKTKFGQVPIAEIDGVEFAQSNAILIYVGKVSGLYPSDPKLALRVDEVMGLVDDFVNALRPSLAVGRDPELNEEQKKEKIKVVRTKFVTEEIPKFMGYFERLLQDNGSGYFVSDSPTIADLVVNALVAWFAKGTLDHIPTNCIDAYPLIAAHYNRINSLPQIQAYRAALKKAN